MNRLVGYTFVIGLVSVVNGSASAQAPHEADALRRAWGGHAGMLVYGTGADVNCANGAGFSLGAEIRTRGPGLAAFGVDALLAAAMVCTAVGVTTSFRGATVDVSSGMQLMGTPRIRVRAGRAFTGGQWSVEPTVGGGLIYSRTDSFREDRWSWNGWAGGSVALRRSGIPVGFEIEYGGHQVPIRYRSQSTPGSIVYSFRRWKPFLRLSVVI